MDDPLTLQQVVSEYLQETPTTEIPRNRVYDWMGSPDVEVLGATFKLLHTPAHYVRIHPPLVFEDYQRFHLKYYERCILGDPSGEWADSRYLAAHSFVGWFMGLWQDSTVARSAFGQRQLFLSSASIRTCQ
jgi:hypothetical protein